MERIRTDILVIGAGVAGLRAAIAGAMGGGHVIVLAKDGLQESNTRYAQGGIAVVLSDEDRILFHYEDTMKAGDGLSSEEAVRILVEEGPERVEELIEWGAEFDREGGKLVFGLEGAHSKRRVLHAQGDSTGREIVRTLLIRAQHMDGITFYEHAYTLDLVCHHGECVGALILCQGELVFIQSSAVILATGGAGRAYLYTTNPPFATADGIGIAFRAGALLADMEFFQFHPTAMDIEGAPHFLISEAVRGEGAWLVNEKGERFVFQYDPRGEVASRDIVARAIYTEQRKGHRIFLDARHFPPGFFAQRFPRIYRALTYFGYDPEKHLIPITPAAHYYMGGVFSTTDTSTSIPRLYAAGEVACNGVHGANRLASNSLLEGLVYGARAGERALSHSNPNISQFMLTLPQMKEAHEFTEKLPPFQHIAWEKLGLIRNAEDMKSAIETFLPYFEKPCPVVTDRVIMEQWNMMTMLFALGVAGFQRTESRGAHYREDYPEKDERNWCRHQVMDRAQIVDSARKILSGT